MLSELTFSWKCPNCKNINCESDVSTEEIYICEICNASFYFGFDVEVSEFICVNEAEREEEKWKKFKYEKQNPMVQISSDNGKTWRKERINTLEFDANKSNLKNGDIIELPTKHKYKIYVTDGKISTEEIKS